MVELKPCPCCNGKATCFAEDDGYRMRLGDSGGATTDGESEFRGVAGCEACGLGFEEWHGSDEIMFDGCEEPDEFEAVLERHMAAKWNARWERMCCMEDRDQDGFEVPSGVCGDGFCSECWGIIAVEDKFCCHCGARIEAK